MNPSTSSSDRRKRIVIVGGGFAGLQAARSLRRADADVILLDRRNFHLFQPLLYQVATGELSPANIATPLRGLLRRHANTQVLLGEVVGIDLQRRQLQTTDSQIDFDYLLLAAGATPFYFGQEHWKQYAPGLKTIENATEIRRQILGAFEAAERSSDPAAIQDLLTFVIVGGGPTGCELAGTIAEIANHTLAHDFRSIYPASSRILLIESGTSPLDIYPAPLPQRAGDDLRRLGVEIISHTRVTDIQADHVVATETATGQSQRIGTRTVLWAAGVRANPLGQCLAEAAGVEAARGGRVDVQADLSVPGFQDVFVCGDLARYVDPKAGELPGLAPVATQMGGHAAKNVLADLSGRPRQPFRYRDKGSLAVIGRFKAVGVIGNWKVKGFTAWFVWLAIHLMYITMFRNRLLVLTQWGWTFLTRDRSARLITDGPNNDISTMEQSTGWDEDPIVPPTSVSES